MKRQLCLSLFLAALAAPAAVAGSDIVKCVDGAGRVTLTDQACEADTATVRLASMPAEPAPARAEPAPLVVEQGFLPAQPVQRRQFIPRTRSKPLMRDVATLKAARAQFLLYDALSGRPALATLD
jgi:hypothetical protein